METGPHSYAFGAFRLDVVERALYADGSRVVLTPKAIETLLALVERHGRVVSKDELFQRVWPDAFVEENNLAQNVSLLRRVLGEGTSGGRFIETVPKRGYRFVAPVTELIAPDHATPPATAPPTLAPAAGGVPARAPRPSWTARRQIVLAVAAAVFIVLAGLTLPRTRGRPAAGEGLTGEGAATFAAKHRALPRIAILPFANLGPDDREYVAAGLTEEIASRFSSLRGLAVRSSATVAAYDRRGKAVDRMGADLDVDYLLDGMVQWISEPQNPTFNITPKLIRVADGATVWTDDFEGALANLATVQAEISHRVASALQVALDTRERRAVEARPTADSEAYLAFLRGIAAYQDGYSDTANQVQARGELEHAVARDPQFADAWSWLSRTYTVQYRTGADRSIETRDAAYRAARTAIELDGGLAHGHLALGQALFADREYAAARRELEIARVGLPNLTELWLFLGHLEQAEGRWTHARKAFGHAFHLDPPAAAQWMTVHYLHFRNYAEARRFIGIARAANKAASVVPEAWLRFSESGDVAAARPVLETALGARSPADARVRGLLARLEWFDGRQERALDLIKGMDSAGAWLPANFRFPAAVAAGQVYESMGRHEDALRSYAAALPELQARERRSPDDYQVQAALALTTLGLRRYSDARRYAERAAALLPVSRDGAEGPLYLYLLAQIYANTRNPQAAFSTLDQLFDVPGFYNEHWVQHDPGFAPLWQHPSFHTHVARWAMQRGDLLLEK
jgi:DNA-binding winged helix-turn-helix (wHTH) protein/TolB-like protein